MPNNLKKRLALQHRRRLRLAKRAARHPLFTVPVSTFLGLLLLSVVGFLIVNGGQPTLKPSDSHIVIISHDKKERVVPTHTTTVGQLLVKLNIALREGDVVEPSLDTQIVEDNFRVNVYRAMPVTIVDGVHKTFAFSAAATPRSVVKQAGIDVYPEDRLTSLPTENFLTESSIGPRVVIERSYPVIVNLYGNSVPMRTLATTVEDLLEEKNIKLAPGDSVHPKAQTPIRQGDQIFVLTKDTQIEFVGEDIAPPTQIVNERSLSFGATVVRQKGQPGKRLVTYQVNSKTGERKKIQEVTVQEPVTEIVAKGSFVDIPGDKTTVMAAAGIGSGDFAYASYIIAHESRWNPAALNASGCAGLGQACPGSKLAAVCPGWQTDAVCQLRFFDSYAERRYGSWSAAYQHKVATGWW